MIMRRIQALIGRDLKAAVRDYLVLFSLLAPLLVALVLRAVIPAAGTATISIVVTAETPPAMVAALREYAAVEVVGSLNALEARVLQLDDAVGIAPAGGSYEVILEGNEGEDAASLPAAILAHILGPSQVEVIHRDLGTAQSPLRPFASTAAPLIAMLIGGCLIGFNIVEDKESQMIPALGTTPLSRTEYIAGRSLLAGIMSVVITVASLYVMGTWPVNLGQVLVITGCGIIPAVILGLYIGAVATNQIETIGVVKLAALPYVVMPLLVFFVPAQWHWAMYWLPTYWTTAGFKAMLLEQALWSEILRLAAIGLAVGLVFLVLSWRRLRTRLALRG